jgi:signal peptidase I
MKGSAMFKNKLIALLIGLFAGLIMLIQPYKFVVVVGDSMLPTFKSGNILLAKKVDSIRTGDVVVA